MQISAENTADYISKIPQERQPAFQKLIETIRLNMPKGFEEVQQYSMPTWVIPLSDYPAGYHCTPDTPLPFLSVASQKNFIALYHMGMYSKPELLEWFQSQYPKYSTKKLDMGKSCVRFKKPDDIPYEIIAQLCQKITPEEWIQIYEGILNKNKKKT